jgi:hypothetical protein
LDSVSCPNPKNFAKENSHQKQSIFNRLSLAKVRDIGFLEALKIGVGAGRYDMI